MAFNPFHWFRKHQKVIFAGLTILCMLVFIGQFGAGDVVQRALAYFGAGRGGATVAKVYGHSINEREYERLLRARQMANAFVQEAVLVGQSDEFQGRRMPMPTGGMALRDVENLAKEEEKAGSPLARLNTVVKHYRDRSFARMGFSRKKPEDLLTEVRADFVDLADMASDPQVKDDPARLQPLERMASLLGFEAWFTRTVLVDGRPEWYFGGSRRPDDMLDFVAWKHQADKLGIVLTDEDVSKEVNREAGQDLLQPKDFADNRLVKEFLAVSRQAQGVTARELLEAVRDEFRVALAQGVLVGLEPGARGYRVWLGAGKAPAYATPDEFLRYFREQRTTLRVKLLGIPVSRYVDKVRGRPTEEELRQRYEEYKDQEPDPARRTPGFKEPRRIKLQYVSVGPAQHHYKDLARKQVEAALPYSDPKTGPALHFAAGASAGSAAAVGGLPGALGVTLPAAFDPLHAEYLDYLEKNTHPWYSPEGEVSAPDKAKKLQPTSLLRPDVAASTFGQLLGAGRANAFAAPAALYAAATAAEVRDSVRFNAALILAHASPGQQFPAVPVAFTRFSLAAPFLPEVSPRQARPELVASLERRYAEQIVQANLSTFLKEVDKLKGKPKEAAAYVKKAAAEYHFQLGSTQDVLSEIAVTEALERKADPGLTALYEARRKAVPGLRPGEFAKDLFAGTGVYQPQPAGLLEEGRELFYWRAEDHPARVRPFDAVRDEVLHAWRFGKARVLARQEARRLAEEVNKHNSSPAEAERFLREQGQGEPFELDRVAPLVAPEKEVHPFMRTEYQPYQVPEDKKDLLPHPPADLAKELLARLKKPGEAAWIADRPERHFYVAVLFNRDEPSLKQFAQVYQRVGEGHDGLWDRFLERQREDYRRQVVEQMRREGGKVDDQGRWEIPTDIRARLEGREGGE